MIEAVTGASGLLRASIILQARSLSLDVAGLCRCHPVHKTERQCRESTCWMQPGRGSCCSG